MLSALALIAFIIESLFPPLFVPGAKMGLGNIFTMLALILYGGFGGTVTVLVKCLLGSVFSGNFSGLLYSLPAGLAALAFEYVTIKFLFPRISVIAVSVGAAVIHNAVQNLIFCLVTSAEAVIYLPYLALIGAVSGLIVGLAVFSVTKLLPEKLIHTLLNE